MNSTPKTLVAVTLGLMAVTAVLLNRLQAAQKLGQPGVEVVAHKLFDENGDLAATNAVFLPERVLNMEGKDQPITQVELNWLPRDTTYGRRLYEAPDGFTAQLTVVLMGSDRTSIHKPEQCLTGQGLPIDRDEALTIPILDPHAYELPVKKLTATRQSTTATGEKIQQRALYVYWFVADGELTASHNQRMKSMARHLVTRGELQRWAYVSCLAYCPPGHEAAAYARMEELIAAAVPQFQLASGPARVLASKP